MRVLLVFVVISYLLTVVSAQRFSQFAKNAEAAVLSNLQKLRKDFERGFLFSNNLPNEIRDSDNNKINTITLQNVAQNYADQQHDEAFESKNLRGALSATLSESSEEQGALASIHRMLFNVFRSYADTPMSEKPPQYSRKGRITHDMSEYLSADQMRMKAGRTANSVPFMNQFDGSWSGHKQYEQLKALKGKVSQSSSTDAA
jgi:hypothetical protein